jgi:hypothetical protein
MTAYVIMCFGMIAGLFTGLHIKAQVAIPQAVDWSLAGYILTALSLGSLSSLANLMGSDRQITFRVVLAYVLVGGLCSAGLVMLAVERLGASYFVIGLSVFAGYKAFDLMAGISSALTIVAKKFLNQGSDKK